MKTYALIISLLISSVSAFAVDGQDVATQVYVGDFLVGTKTSQDIVDRLINDPSNFKHNVTVVAQTIKSKNTKDGLSDAQRLSVYRLQDEINMAVKIHNRDYYMYRNNLIKGGAVIGGTLGAIGGAVNGAAGISKGGISLPLVYFTVNVLGFAAAGAATSGLVAYVYDVYAREKTFETQPLVDEPKK